DSEAKLGPDHRRAALSNQVKDNSRESGNKYEPEVAKATSEAERAGTLGMSLEEQWRQRRSSRMAAVISEE
ncbi:MAG: hypothetical protein LIP18_08055, partial [Planctomycetes bacterium]|nr:hypothetical protein [Planctomycetota bacterium]